MGVFYAETNKGNYIPEFVCAHILNDICTGAKHCLNPHCSGTGREVLQILCFGKLSLPVPFEQQEGDVALQCSKIRRCIRSCGIPMSFCCVFLYGVYCSLWFLT